MFSTSIEEMFSPPEMMMSLPTVADFEVAVRMHDRQITREEPAISNGAAGSLSSP